MNKLPIPLFDSLQRIRDTNSFPYTNKVYLSDYNAAKDFLLSYTGSLGTFNSYRREVERLLHWSILIAKKQLKELRRKDIENFVNFCLDPPKEWVGAKKSRRFIEIRMERIANAEWRPFISGELSQGSIKEIFAILSTFFTYLMQEEHVLTNPVIAIRQKSKYIRTQSVNKIRRLSKLQLRYVLECAHDTKDPRKLFIVTAMYSMYLRISELASSERWTPKMCDFFRDHDGNWWFKTVGKGNKERHIAVSNSMLEALKNYREALGLSPFPGLTENAPLLSKTLGKGPLCSTTHLREMIQIVFNTAYRRLVVDGFTDDASLLRDATTHWLRHTGISDDVKHRPREHVRDDAGHSSSATTDKYIDVELRERHLSAVNKLL